MVFSRSRPVLARYDVSSHMVKWWKGQKPDNGQVRGWWSLFHGMKGLHILQLAEMAFFYFDCCLKNLISLMRDDDITIRLRWLFGVIVFYWCKSYPNFFIFPRIVSRVFSLPPLQVTRSLSPYEQQIIVPWLKTWPKRVSVTVILYWKFQNQALFSHVMFIFSLISGIC